MNPKVSQPAVSRWTCRQVGIVAALLILLPARAQAQYIDPGSTSLLWQMLVAATLGVSFHFRYYLKALVGRFRSKRNDETSEGPNEQ